MELPPERPTPHLVEHVTETGSCHVGDHQVPLVELRTAAVVDLPPPIPSVGLIVSRVVADASPDRTDVLVPFNLIRDDAGRVIGCRAFARITGETRCPR